MDELVENEVEEMSKGDERAQRYFGFIHGFQKAVELLGDKKFSEEDMIGFGRFISKIDCLNYVIRG